MERNLAYWKARKIDIRNCKAEADSKSSYWADLCQAYRFASRKVEMLERKILVKGSINEYKRTNGTGRDAGTKREIL